MPATFGLPLELEDEPISPPQPIRVPRVRIIPAVNIERNTRIAIVISSPGIAVKRKKIGRRAFDLPRTTNAEITMGCQARSASPVYEIATEEVIPATPLS